MIRRRHRDVLGLFMLFVALATTVGASSPSDGAPTDDRGRFRNNYPHDEHGFRDLVRWMREHRSVDVDPIRFPAEPNAVESLHAAGDSGRWITWIGHSTFLLQIDGVTVLTDPHFTDRASPVSFAGPERTTPPGIRLEDLPPIDLVLISHNHYDHLDKGSIQALLAQQPGDHQPFLLVPAGLTDTLVRWGSNKVAAKDWWSSIDLTPYIDGAIGFVVTSVPVQHFSARTPFDRNRTLWTGWVIDVPEAGQIFFAGDTGYSKDFAEIRRRLGPMDLSLLPVGAYDPRWFMEAMHVDPEQAVQIHLDLESRLSIGMHWGTFILTDEPMREPVERLRAARDAAGIAPEDFVVLRHGETRGLELSRDIEAHSP